MRWTSTPGLAFVDTKRGSVVQSWNGHDARVVASQDYAVAVLGRPTRAPCSSTTAR
ncbi:MAG TPA: hypothetical protein VGL61_04375 [Kofleriaceae bacterium]